MTWEIINFWSFIIKNNQKILSLIHYKRYQLFSNDNDKFLWECFTFFLFFQSPFYIWVVVYTIVNIFCHKIDIKRICRLSRFSWNKYKCLLNKFIMPRCLYHGQYNYNRNDWITCIWGFSAHYLWALWFAIQKKVSREKIHFSGYWEIEIIKSSWSLKPEVASFFSTKLTT